MGLGVVERLLVEVRQVNKGVEVGGFLGGQSFSKLASVGLSYRGWGLGA
jgi:hypothetical protein